MNRAAAARPSGVDAEPEPWERVAFEAAVHSDPIELVGAKRALKAFFFRLLPDIKATDRLCAPGTQGRRQPLIHLAEKNGRLDSSP